MFRPGQPFPDVDGNPIQAHAASILRHGDHWYWYGQDMGGRHTPADPSFTGISVYRSSDLVSWKRLGTALAPTQRIPKARFTPTASGSVRRSSTTLEPINS